MLSSPLPPAVWYVFRDRKGILLPEFMAPGTKITAEVYCETLNKLRRLIKKKKCRGPLTKGVFLLHDNARPHTMARTNTVIPRLTSDPANEDFFRCFLDSANEYGFG